MWKQGAVFRKRWPGKFSRTEEDRGSIGRNKRDYVWIMARTPQIPEADYQRLRGELGAQGYDLTKLRQVPQRWPAK